MKQFDTFRANETAARIRENIARAKSGLDPLKPEPLYKGESVVRMGGTITSIGRAA